MNLIKKYIAKWPHLAVAAGYALAFLEPSLRAWIAANPKSTGAVIAGAVIAAYHATAPKDRQ